MKRLLANLGLALASLLLTLAVVELGLRLTGFHFSLKPEDIEFGQPDPVLLQVGFLDDPDVFWVPKGYPAKLEQLRRERPPLILMGDSCTHLGHYDVALAELFEQRRGGQLAYGNVGVAGWSSYQGLRQLERDILPLAPRVLTLYYGWNDHWIGFGAEDKEVARIKAGIATRWSHLRLAQLWTKARLALGGQSESYPNRVSLDDFRANLRAMVAAARGADITPMLLTAPTSHQPGAEPEYLAARWLRDLGELVPLHQSYVAAVRGVAAETGAPLCDLERRFSKLKRGEIEASFLEDGIHLTAEGDRRLAGFLFGCLEQSGLIEELTGVWRPGLDAESPMERRRNHE